MRGLKPAEVFATVDLYDPQAFSELFASDARFVFGNEPALVGPAAIKAGIAEAWTTMSGLSHHIVNEWSSGDHWIVETDVTYRRLDGNAVTIPVVSVWHVAANGLVDEYRVYLDMSPVFA